MNVTWRRYSSSNKQLVIFWQLDIFHTQRNPCFHLAVFQRCCFLLGVPETRITGPIMLRAAPSCRAATLTGFKMVIRVFLFLVSGNMFLQRNVCPSHANGLHLTFDCTAFVFVWLHWDVLACHLSLMTRFCWWTTVASHGFFFIVLCINDYHL